MCLKSAGVSRVWFLTAVLAALIAGAAAFPQVTRAFSSYGELKYGLVYRELRMRRYGPQNYLAGQIVNRSRGFVSGVSVSFKAYNVFEDLIWQTQVYIDSLEPGEKMDFSKRLGVNADFPLKLEVKAD